MTEEIEIKRNDGSIEYMSIDELSRWVSLIESFNLIQEECEKRNLKPENYLNSKAIEGYISDRFNSVRSDLIKEYYMGLL